MKNFLGVLTICLASIGTADATLIDRGGGLIYDDDLNVTWLWDANYAQTSGASADGFMNWAEAMAWVSGLNYGGYTDWRLPKQIDMTCYIGGYNCTGSEYGHLFYLELGGQAGRLLRDVHNNNYDLFQNIDRGWYWTGTIYEPEPWAAWDFAFDGGATALGCLPGYCDYLASYLKVWPVRDGDVAAIPEPATYAMMLGGLGLFGFVAHRRKRG